MRTYRRNKQRTGSVLVLTAVMMMAMFGILALAVDLGYIHVVRSEMQTAADATALAATWELIDQDCLTGEVYPPYTIAYCREVVRQPQSGRRGTAATGRRGRHDRLPQQCERPDVFRQP